MPAGLLRRSNLAEPLTVPMVGALVGAGVGVLVGEGVAVGGLAVAVVVAVAVVGAAAVKLPLTTATLMTPPLASAAIGTQVTAVVPALATL